MSICQNTHIHACKHTRHPIPSPIYNKGGKTEKPFFIRNMIFLSFLSYLCTQNQDLQTRMEQKNKFISVSYTLYDTTGGKSELIEQTSPNRNFTFISGMGITLPAFEEAIINLGKGERFDFTLSPEDAYGEHYDQRIIDLDKSIFTINGKFDSQHVQVGAIIPLQNEDGNHFNGVVLEIGGSKVKIDLNHPLAGMTLNFKGEIAENRDATTEEMEQMMRHEGGCGGCHGKCGGHCGEDGHCGDGGHCGEGGCKGTHR